MHKLPEAAWFHPLKGQRLVEICCTINQIIFHFSDNAWLIAVGEFTYSRDAANETIAIPLSGHALTGLLERAVRGIGVSEDRAGLALSFEGNQSLTFASDASYESFHVCINGDERTV